MPPKLPGRRVIGKTAPAARSRTRKLARLKSRRLAVGEFNALLAELSLPLQALRPKALDVTLFAKVLRILSKRCRGDDRSRRFAAALQRFTHNGGALPDGMEFCPDSTVLDVSSVGLPDEPSAVPGAQVLAHALPVGIESIHVDVLQCFVRQVVVGAVPRPHPRQPFCTKTAFTKRAFYT